jgi:uncharacterized protein YegP (UPF0339 family)
LLADTSRRNANYWKEAKMATGYEYFTIERRTGGYRAYFYASNDELVWWTETYTYKSGAQYAIDLIKAKGVNAPVYDRT